jgi:methylenetetrahydrofolate dehydrogenase (NADP+)/methenyltetrahydrofolate cyclohydrolase
METQQARLMEGTDLARRMTEASTAAAEDIRRRTEVSPGLATVLVGEDPASVTYVRMKQARCAKAGIDTDA